MASQNISVTVPDPYGAALVQMAANHNLSVNSMALTLIEQGLQNKVQGLRGSAGAAGVVPPLPVEEPTIKPPNL